MFIKIKSYYYYITSVPMFIEDLTLLYVLTITTRIDSYYC